MPERTFAKPKLTHVAYRVADMDASIAFYRKYCDLTVVHERRDKESGSRVTWLDEVNEERPRFVIVLYQDGHPLAQKSDFNHLGYAMASREDVDKVAALAKEEGRLVLGPTYLDDVVGYIANVKDPDGNIVEFSHGQVLGETD